MSKTKYSRNDVSLAVSGLIAEEQLVKEATSMMEEIEPELKLVTCPVCASVVQIDKGPPEVYFCSFCQRSYSKDDLDALWQVSFDAIYFGLIYRKRYEKDIRKFGKPVAKYLLPTPDPWLVAIGLMILSGLIGGMAYDGFKASLNKVRERLKKSHPNDKRLWKLISSMNEKDAKEMYDSVMKFYKVKCIRVIKSILRDFGVSTNKRVESIQTQALLVIAMNSKRGKTTKLRDLLSLFPNENKETIIKDCIGRLRLFGFIKVPKTGEFSLSENSLSELLNKQEKRINLALANARRFSLDTVFEGIT